MTWSDIQNKENSGDNFKKTIKDSEKLNCEIKV